jgi:hypothetical protein
LILLLDFCYWVKQHSAVASKKHSDLEDKLVCSRAELRQVTTFLDGAREAKQVTTMKIRRGEKESWGTPSRTLACLLHVVSPLFGVLRYAGRSANARGWGWSAEGRKLSLMHPRDNLEGLYKDAIVDLTTLQNSHNLTMTDLDKKRSELALLQGLVDGLHDHCPPRILHSRRTYELCRGLKRRSWRF